MASTDMLAEDVYGRHALRARDTIQPVAMEPARAEFIHANFALGAFIDPCVPSRYSSKFCLEAWA